VSLARRHCAVEHQQAVFGVSQQWRAPGLWLTAKLTANRSDSCRSGRQRRTSMSPLPAEIDSYGRP
jgi:hypothetical protein